MTTLFPTYTLGSLVLTDYPFAVEFGGNHGAPESTTELRQSMLADGDLVSNVRSGNREVTLTVHVEGADLGEVAINEALLRAECRRPSELTFDPGDDLAPASVFQVLSASMVHARDDNEEMHNLHRWELTLTCAPFARSANATTLFALAPPPEAPIVESITNADTTTGWSAAGSTYSYPAGPSNVTVPVTDGGSNVTASIAGDWPSLQLTYTLSAPVSMASTRYLVIEVSGTAPSSFRMIVDGVASTPTPALTRATSPATVLYVFDTGGGTLSSFGIVSDKSGSLGASITLRAHDAYRTNTLPQVNTRQTSGVIEVGGTERTPCSLKLIPGAGEALGVAIVHTSPEEGTGYSPSLRQYRASGNTVTQESGRLSGAREPVNANPVVALVPISSLPEDGYSLVAFMRSSVVGTFSFEWQARTIVNGSYYLGGDSGTAQARFFDANTWTLVPLAMTTLPPVRATEGGTVQLNITHTPVGAEVIDMDEWWAFRMGDDCALTIVQEFETSFLWLDSPDSSSPVPRIWVGGNSDRSDQHHPGVEGLIAQGNHVLHPDGTSVFAASTGITHPTLSATYYKRWHSNAAE